MLALRRLGRLALAIGCSVGGAAASLVLPRLFGQAVDQTQALLNSGLVQASEARQALIMTALLVIATTTVRGGLAMGASYQAECVSQRVACDLRLDFFRQLQQLSFRFHDQAHSGDLISRGMSDLEGARSFLQGALMPALSLLLLLGFTTWMMFSADPLMAVVGLGFVPVAAWTMARMGIGLRKSALLVQEHMSKLSLTMEDNLQGIRVVRAFAAQIFEMAKFDKASRVLLDQTLESLRLRCRGVTGMTVCYYACMGFVLWLGGRRVLGGAMSIGQLTEFVSYMMLLQGPIRQIAGIFQTVARAKSSGERLFEVLDLEPDVRERSGAAPAPTSGVLAFEQVSFAYGPGQPNALNEISFEVRPGKTLGIVGAPGSGKSTLVQLIPRFYDATAGRITIDGVDVRDLQIASLRRFVGLVQQDAFLFDTSVGHNLAYADPWASEERLVEAARLAQIDGHVAALPDGYETRVGERGVALSGGQRQRLSIARGVVADPEIMIFDDSTAAIDALTEQKVREALTLATRGKTTIIVAHRLTSLMHADEIIVLNAGQIIERGDHQRLLAFGGVYAELYRLQSAQPPALPDIAIRPTTVEMA